MYDPFIITHNILISNQSSETRCEFSFSVNLFAFLRNLD